MLSNHLTHIDHLVAICLSSRLVEARVSTRMIIRNSIVLVTTRTDTILADYISVLAYWLGTYTYMIPDEV